HGRSLRVAPCPPRGPQIPLGRPGGDLGPERTSSYHGHTPMLARHSDPIAAIATAPGRGAVGIVRVSGKGLAAVMQALCGRSLKPREATYLPFLDAQGQAIDQGLALFFPAPHSFTGEDVLELQAHGGAVVLQLLLARALEAGAAQGLRV